MGKELHIKKGDTVLVIAGSEKGSRGKVIYANPEKEKVAIQKINLVKRHQKPNKKHPTGGIVEKEAPVHASNVKLLCPKCQVAVRARKQRLEDGSVMRRCPECNEVFK